MNPSNDNLDAVRVEHMNAESRFTLIVGVVAFTIFAGGILWLPKSASGESVDSQTLSLDAFGCVATTPAGQPLKQALEEGLKIIPKGTTFTPQCFGRKG